LPDSKIAFKLDSDFIISAWIYPKDDSSGTVFKKFDDKIEVSINHTGR